MVIVTAGNPVLPTVAHLAWSKQQGGCRRRQYSGGSSHVLTNWPRRKPRSNVEDACSSDGSFPEQSTWCSQAQLSTWPLQL